MSASRKAERVRSPSTGLTRRVFKGQRWLVITQDNEEAPCDVLAFCTREQAKRVSDRLYRSFRPEVHYVEEAEVLA